MNSKELQNREIFVRVGEFGKRHAADFPAATIAGTLFTELEAIAASLDTHAAAEYSHTGGGKQKQATKADSHDLLESRLRAIGRTARAIAVTTPNFDRNFTIPARPTDRELLDLARSFAEAATPYAAEFVKFSMPSDFLSQLNAEATAFAEAMSEKRLVRAAKSDAMAAIDAAIERGMNIVRQLEAIVRNTFHDDATITEWKRASRPERAKSRPAPEPAKSAAA